MTMNFESDNRIVMTLDAGGTNFVFSAMQTNKMIIEPVTVPAMADNLDLCLKNIIAGFKDVADKLGNQKPVAISFAFPGPADYKTGIISDLANLPAFRGGVALGPMLEDIFNIPVFINNDGNLYAYGEAIAGYLPEINRKLAESGSPRRFRNLVGFTLGTGFGAGIVLNNRLIIGDNSNAGEVWLLRNKFFKNINAEASASIRAIKREYARAAELRIDDVPEPRDIYTIAKGERSGNQPAAVRAFHHMAEAIGDAAANVATLIDGLIVFGGGISGARDIFMPVVVDEMNSSFQDLNGNNFPRMAVKAFNTENPHELSAFLTGEKKKISIPFSNKKISYDPMMRIGVGVSKIGTSEAISIGAYAFALQQLDKK